MKLSLKTVLAGVVMLVGVSGCGEVQVRNPLAKQKVLVETAVPTDFAVVLEENQDTYYARQHIRQVVTAGDLTSRTTYMTLRDLNNTVANEFTHEQPLTQMQMQQMWNEVAKYNLMEGASVWYYWKSFPDKYRRDEHIIQIRANGKTQSFRQLNHWGYKLRDLALQVEAVRFTLGPRRGTVPAGTVLPGATGVQQEVRPAATSPAAGVKEEEEGDMPGTRGMEPSAWPTTGPTTGPASEPGTRPWGPSTGVGEMRPVPVEKR